MSSKIEALLLDIELLIQIVLEKDSLGVKNTLLDSAVKELVKLKDMAKSHRETVSIHLHENVDFKNGVSELRRRLINLKYIPGNYKEVIEEIIFKVTRCIDSIKPSI